MPVTLCTDSKVFVEAFLLMIFVSEDVIASLALRLRSSGILWHHLGDAIDYPFGVRVSADPNP